MVGYDSEAFFNEVGMCLVDWMQKFQADPQRRHGMFKCNEVE